MPFVLDASVTLTWALREERNLRGTELLTAAVESYVVVPALFPTEVFNALLMAERRNRITNSESDDFLTQMKSLDIRVAAATWESSEEALQMARAEQLTVYDASYLCLAQSLALPLATFDGALVRAAMRRGVPIL